MCKMLRCAGYFKRATILGLLASLPVFAPAPGLALSVEAQRAIRPVHDALQRVRDEQARQGPPCSVPDRLIRLGDLDQAARTVLPNIDLSRLPWSERVPASDAMWHEINAQDAADQAALMAIMPATGWFTSDRYGAAASTAAWSVVQHATYNLPLMRTALGRIKRAERRHRVSADDYAKLLDRVAMLRHEPQAYGTQFTCVDHRWKLYDLADPAHVEQRRASLGMSETQHQETVRMASYPACFFGP